MGQLVEILKAVVVLALCFASYRLAVRGSDAWGFFLGAAVLALLFAL